MDTNTANNEGCGRTYNNEVCANVQKIYDTCKDKDCLADMRVYFSNESQSLVDGAINIRAKNARIVHANVSLDSVPFNRGYYAVDTTFFFVADFELYCGPSGLKTVSGICSCQKKVILYGGEGNTTTFSSDDTRRSKALTRNGNMPVAQVEVVDPIVLSSKLVNANSNCCCCCETDVMSIPESVRSIFGQDITDGGDKLVLLSLGLFSIVRIVRDIQVMIPSARFCLPDKQCQAPTEEDSCSFFEKLSFPTGEFFPRDIGIESNCNDN